MKIAALLTALALASGTALAAQDASTYDTRDTTATHRSTAAATGTQHKEGIVERTKSAIRHTGEKLGHATRRLPGNRSGNQAVRDDGRSDTSSMGASGSDDSGRQRRVDDAYNNWRSRQK
jgi:uncharacterized protein HemX